MTMTTLLPLETLRALYMGDNYFENISPELGKLRNLQIVSVYGLKLNTSQGVRHVGHAK